MSSEERGTISHDLLWQLVTLPQKIVQLHGMPSLPELVLHELCHDNCFNIDRAAYLLDNPDFDWLKGVAGYTRDECQKHRSDLWQDPYTFDDDMSHAEYHQQVKKFSAKSLMRTADYSVNSETVKSLADSLGMHNPLCFSWGTKHDNHGLLILENPSHNRKEQEQLLQAVMSFLALC